MITANLLATNYASIMVLSMFLHYLLKSSEEPHQLPVLPPLHSGHLVSGSVPSIDQGHYRV